MPGPRAISRSVLADQVKDYLLQGIMAGRFPPNSRIVETRIARDLGTSQAPVREALRGLEALGVVELLPFRGARVRRPTAAELLEAYAVRSSLESLAARLAMPRMDDEAIEVLAGHFRRMQDAARAGDRHEVAIADADFHATLLGVAGNATLERVWASLEPFSRTYITLVAPGADPQWTADLHVPILDAVRRGDTDEVLAALSSHFDQAGRHLAHAWTDGETGYRAAPPAPAPASPDAAPSVAGAQDATSV
jgi:DNA-binding GntR family transcriptional regulator